MASRFWVGGTGSFTDTAHWSALSGSTGGQSVPGSSDTATWDGASGGGACTIDGAAITVQSMTMGAFTGTWDNSVNNVNITVTANGNAFNGSGTGVRTNKMGTATYTLTSATAPVFNYTTVTNLTITSSGASIVFTSGAAVKTVNPGAGTTWGSVTFPAGTGSGRSNLGIGTSTITTLTVTAPGVLQIGLSSTFTIGTINLAGTSASQISVSSDTFGSVGTLALSAGQTAQWAAFRDVTVTGNNLVATSSFNLGNNTGVTITPPSQAHFSGGFFG